MKVLVTGGAGFIGSHIADGLLANGHEVLVVDDLSTGKRENVPVSAEFIQGDIRDPHLVERVFSRLAPAIVVHQAAQTSVSVSTREPFRDADVNIMGTLRLLDAAVRHRVGRFVFASTGGAIYGEVPEGQRATSSWMPRPLSPYACSKLAGENYLCGYGHEYGLPFTILRYANVYGPRQDPHGEAGVVAIFTRKLLAGEAIRINARRAIGDEGCVRDYVYVGDVVAANLRAVEGAITSPIVNIATGNPTSTLELAHVLAGIIGISAEIDHGPKRVGDLERSLLEPDIDAVGGRVRGLQAGLADTVAWFRRDGAETGLA